MLLCPTPPPQLNTHPPPLHFLSDSSFQVAASMKLGAAMGEMSKPSKGGATKEAFCSSDADCSDNETCKSGNCVNVCNPSPCPSDEFCLNEGNHSYSCVECTSNEQCDDREICKNNSCVDACTGNPCASKNQACSSQSGHSYICYGCINDKGCPSGKICDIPSKTCVDASCPSGYSTAVTSCGAGYSLSRNGSVGGKPCGKCVTLSCPSGYSTSVRDCYGLPGGIGSWQLETNGASGGVACGKCVPIPCPTDFTYCKNGYPGYEMSYNCKMSGSNRCYSCCPKDCPTGSKLEMSPSIVNTPGYCPSGKIPKHVGYSSSFPCFTCI